VLNLWLNVASMESDGGSEMADYFNVYARDILQRVTDYLRKELKVPLYSEMFSEEMQFESETQALFNENP